MIERDAITLVSPFLPFCHFFCGSAACCLCLLQSGRGGELASWLQKQTAVAITGSLVEVNQAFIA